MVHNSFLWAHRLVTASLGFLVAVILLGGPLGLVPALASLLATARSWRQHQSPQAYGIFWSVWHGATRRWTAALPAVVPVTIIAALLALELTVRTTTSLIALVVIGLWCLIALDHMALRLSLGLSAWNGLAEGWRMLALGWLHLVAVAAWLALALLARPISLLLLPLFGPALVALGADRLGGRASRAVLGSPP